MSDSERQQETRKATRQQGNTAGKATSQQNKYKYHFDKATGQQISINTIFCLEAVTERACNFIFSI